MNREILFRGKRADNGEWVTSSSLIQCYDNDNNGARMFYIAQKNEEYIAICSRETSNISAITCKDKARFYKVIPKTVGQYTGLTDKNGNRIFEGDIVEFDNDKIGYVVYDEQETEYGIVYDENVYCGLGRDYIDKALEVVGNIHDSELLEET